MNTKEWQGDSRRLPVRLSEGLPHDLPVMGFQREVLRWSGGGDTVSSPSRDGLGNMG